MNFSPDSLADRANMIDARRGTSDNRVWNDGDIRTIGSIGRSTNFIDRAKLRSAVPSAFAEMKHERTSERYSFLPTSSVLDGLEAEGWLPVLAQEQRVRDSSRDGFQKHMIRFAHVDSVGDAERPELVLLNSSDRSSSYTLHAGIFRAVCMNGLVVCDATFSKVCITHVGFEPQKVIDVSVELVRDVPRLMAGVAEMKAIELSPSQRLAFAEAAMIAKYEDLDKAPVPAEKLLNARRNADARTDLWSTFNVVQENLIKGGISGRRRTPRGSQRVTTRPVRGIDGNVALNKALWHLTEAMKEKVA